MGFFKSLFGGGKEREEKSSGQPSEPAGSETAPAPQEQEESEPQESLPEPEYWSPLEVKQRLDSGEELVLVDVREEPELQICRIEDSTHIPLGAIRARHGELPKDKTLVCYCHHGMRSEMAAYELLDAGFTKVVNLTGGIHAWAIEVDTEMRRY